MSFRGAGQLRHRITLQEQVETHSSTTGAVSRTWQDVATNPNVWARMEPLTGREFFDAQQMQAEMSVRFTIRHRSDVTAKMAVLFGGKRYNIQAVLPDQTDATFLELMCAEGVTDGS